MPPLPVSRDIPDYDGLGFFAAQETPYAVVETEVAFIDLLTQDEFPVNPDPALEERFGSTKEITRFGWLKDNSVYSGTQQRLIGEPPSLLEDVDADKDNVFYLQRGDGKYLIETDAGLDFSDAEADMDARVQIAKVVGIPYRWRRPGQAVGETRQTQLFICYNGPSNG